MKIIWIRLSIVLSVIALAEFAWFQVGSRLEPGHGRFASMTTSWVKAPRPVAMPDFLLVGGQGRTFRLQDLRGQWHLLVFGYTSCRDVCPTTLNTLSLTVNYMWEHGLTPIPQVIFISVDPDRDSPAHLADYVAHFNKDFIGLTGTPSELKSLLHALGSDYQIDGHRGAIKVNHPTTMFLIDPKGRLTGLFAHTNPPSEFGAEIKVALHSNGEAETFAP
jgi:protein SCO1/2